MAKEMLINTVQKHECRIAVVRNGELQELYVERSSSASHLGNIYKGRVMNIEPAIQAAFIDFGLGKNGFLHISDVRPSFFPNARRSSEPVGKKHPHRDRPPIQKCLRRGQELVVQVIKEGIGTKGPTLTTYLSIAGRLLVLMPGMSRLGVSRKVEDEDARSKARRMLEQLELPPDMGFIVRTAGMDHTKRELQRDLNYLMRLWKAVTDRINNSEAPAEIYQESDLVTRTIRDIYNSDIDRVICDHRADAMSVKEFLNVAVPRSRSKVELYTGSTGLFQDFGLEDQIQQIYSRRVDLRCGGSIVIDQTEALVAIDVNSGRYRSDSNPEAAAVKINLEAAAEATRQLKLRDLGGVIIIDFIDMQQDKNRRAVERAMRAAVKNDRAKTKMSRVSAFGIMEMTRQRVRPSLRDSMHRWCPYCAGIGLIKSAESLALEVMRDLKRASTYEQVARIEVTVTPEVAERLSNIHRKDLHRIEMETNKRLMVHSDRTLAGNEVHTKCFDQRGSEIDCSELGAGSKKAAVKTIGIEELLAAERKTKRVNAVDQPQQKPVRKRKKRTRKPPAGRGKDKPPQKPEPPAPPKDEAKPAQRKRRKTRRGSRGGKRRKKKPAGKTPPAPAGA